MFQQSPPPGQQPQPPQWSSPVPMMPFSPRPRPMGKGGKPYQNTRNPELQEILAAHREQKAATEREESGSGELKSEVMTINEEAKAANTNQPINRM